MAFLLFNVQVTWLFSQQRLNTFVLQRNNSVFFSHNLKRVICLVSLLDVFFDVLLLTYILVNIWRGSRNCWKSTQITELKTPWTNDSPLPLKTPCTNNSPLPLKTPRTNDSPLPLKTPCTNDSPLPLKTLCTNDSPLPLKTPCTNESQNQSPDHQIHDILRKPGTR